MVVGAGVAGLAAALELEKTCSEVVVVDASDRPGGVMRTDHVAGYVVERGPNTFLHKPAMHAALVEHQVASGLIQASPASRKRFLLRDGALQALPTSPASFLGTSLLSAGGKLRLMAEPFVRRGDGAAESVAEFATRRFGAQTAERLIAPFLTGVYAGDAEQLGAGAVFPALVEHERRAGSVVLGALGAGLGRRRERLPAGSASAPEGLGVFARRLAERLSEPPALGTTVRGLRRDEGAWRVELEGPAGSSALRAERVVLAVPAPVAAQLLGSVDERSAELLDGIVYAPVVALPLGVARADLARPAEGFGFLVPPGEPADLLGCLFMSELFPGRAPEDQQLLHCMLGGTRWPAAVDAPEEELVERASRDLERVLGLRGTPLTLGMARWREAIPQPGRDHAHRVAEIRARVASLAGLALAGSHLDGVSVPDAFASGLRAAMELATPV